MAVKPTDFSMSIREARPSDCAIIAGYNVRLAWETEEHRLDLEVLMAGVESLLTDPGKGRYFVVENESGEIIGQTMFTFEWSDWRNGMIWWLQSVYVVESARKQGVFSALLNHVTELAREDPEVCGIRLYVENENETAQQTYLARGFADPNYRVMERLF